MRWIWLLLMCLPNLAFAVPPGFNVVRSTDGAILYQNGSHYVQVIRLDQGGDVRFQHGQKVGSDCFDRMNCEDLETFWGWASGNPDAFATVNGEFFDYPHDPAGLAFTVKADGEMLHCGYGVNDPNECQNQIMVEIWETHARFSTFDRDWRSVENSSAPNVIVALREDCPKNAGAAIERTFIGSQDSNGNELHETFFILTSSSCTQAQAADILRDFGASQVAMLDGGGSTQLICQGTGFIGSSRQIPQTLLSIGSQHYRCSYGNQSNNPNWIWARPGQTMSVWVEFRNDGTETWVGGNCGVGTQNCVELWACDADGVFGESPFYPGTPWINRIRVGKASQTSVPPGSTARFSFDIQIPQVGSQDLHAYFRPTHGGQRMYNWENMNFPIHVDADAPQIPPNLSVNPSDCTSTNSFFFDWDASGDVGSGLKLYTWKINTGGESNTADTFVQVNNHLNVHPGWNTFYVKAEDNAGNKSDWATVQFCLETGCNLSFDEDGDGNGIPDGWEVDAHGGSSFSRVSGGPSGTHYARIVNANSSQWMILARSNCDQIDPGQLYRISFWYNTNSSAPFEWALFKSSVSTGQRSLNALVSNPIADGQWHQFWSAPFSVSSGDLSTYPKFGVKVPPGSVGTFNFDGVFFVEAELCQ